MRCNVRALMSSTTDADTIYAIFLDKNGEVEFVV